MLESDIVTTVLALVLALIELQFLGAWLCVHGRKQEFSEYTKWFKSLSCFFKVIAKVRNVIKNRYVQI